MVTNQSKNILISIKPKYVEAICNGDKRVEFRRSFPKGGAKCFVYVYSSSPVSAVVGYFQVKTIKKETPTMLWKKYKGIGGINQSDFYDYFEGCEVGTAIEFDNFFIWDKPIPLSSLSTPILPPQNFRYVDGSFDMAFDNPF